MTTKNSVEAILQRMEEGTEAIYAQYREKARQAKASYQQKRQELDTDFRENARGLTGAAQVDLAGRLTGLSDLGLASSGAADQARISSRTALLSSLGKLALQHARESAAARTAYENTAASLETEGAEKASKYRDTMTRLLLEQQNKDREFAEKQELSRQKLALSRQKLAQQTSSKNSGTDGIVPPEKPTQMMEAILKGARKYNTLYGYSYVDPSAVKKAVRKIIEDEHLSKTWRYQVYVIARSMGYYT